MRDPTQPIPLYYSAQAAKALGTVVYRTLQGTEVETTIIGDPGGWEDAVQVGETAGDYSGFVRSNRTGVGYMRERWSWWP